MIKEGRREIVNNAAWKKAVGIMVVAGVAVCEGLLRYGFHGSIYEVGFLAYG